MANKTVITTRQILLYLVDGLVTLSQPFDYHGMYYKTINDYFDWREFDKQRFYKNLYRLEKEGLVKKYLRKNKHYIELTNAGKNRVQMYLAKDFKYKLPDKWDKRWRLIIFDIPIKNNRARDVLRERLKNLGCFQIQKSVYIFPFECKDVIDYITSLYDLGPFIQYVVADSIDTEIDLIHEFMSTGILNKNSL
jgi:DNA-binding transcriptional regulator PaaX